MARKTKQAYPVTAHPVAQLEATLRADGDVSRLRTIDERTVLVLNWPGHKFSRAAMSRIAGAH
jgi:hypothetical protein